MTKVTGLKREINKMPPFIKEALAAHKLSDAYHARPAYQQNDYLSWIDKAKLETTREKRLKQMLEELRQGNKYMKMDWNPTT